MDLFTEVLTALAALDPRDCRRPPDGSLWRLRDPGILAGGSRRRAVQAGTRRMLSALARHGGFLRHPEDPADYGARGPWVYDARGTTPLPRDLDPDDDGTRRWLEVGNWQAYAAPEPVYDGWPDPARSGPQDLLRWMARTGVVALLDAFHDEVSWVVALPPEAVVELGSRIRPPTRR